MNYWKSKVLPKIKKAFEKNNPKKAAAAEACKAFDESKEQFGKEFEDKKSELQPKVVEIYEASSAQTKKLIKEQKGVGQKKNSAAVQKFLDELVKIDFPGSKLVSEASSKLGPAYVAGPVSFLVEKFASLIPEEKKEEEAPAAEVKEKEIVVGEESKAEVPPPVAEDAPAAETPAEPPKEEEKPATAVDPTKA
ncbi:unnamed protein product [Cuscuta epithymum]|uniref:Plasma membrane-associated cation-binding protein 1 n=1 Tax=Cuscuta epithymum TaxID=186058 RepID=A0AAV0G0E9_9ASTE|nr:unnamed protein product [Cuscuta epithymum]CAH9141305.1 unnamed protein product [Cuscuta epithymum]